MRSYRGSLAVLERAAKAWRVQPHSFILQLGDIIDGQNSGKYGQGLSKFSPSGCQSDIALHDVLSVFSKYGWSSDKIYSAVGNHEFYCWPDRSALASKIPQICASTSGDGSAEVQFFQSFSPAAGWRVIILDAYDVSIIGRNPHSSEFKEAIDLLRSKNPNILADGSATANFLTNLCACPFIICCCSLLSCSLVCSTGSSRRFVPYNGAIGRGQLDWLQGSPSCAAFPKFYSLAATLDKCCADGESIIICSHVPILPASAIPSCMLWNFEDVLDLIHKHNSSCASGPGRIVSIFSGHFHGGRTVQDSGILYVSLKSPLLSPDAFYSVSSIFGPFASVVLLILLQVELYDKRLRVLSPLGAPYVCDEFSFP